MTRLREGTAVLLTLLALASLAAAGRALAAGHGPPAPRAHMSAAGTSSRFTVSHVTVTRGGGRLGLSLAICAPRPGHYLVRATFVPQHPGVPVAQPGADQYQDRGCWPAAVSASIAHRAPRCAALSCPVVAGRRYFLRARVTDTQTGRSLLTSTFAAVA